MNPWESKNGKKAYAIVHSYVPPKGHVRLANALSRDAAIRWLWKRGSITLGHKDIACVSFYSYPKPTLEESGRTLDHALIRLVLAVEKAQTNGK